MKRSRLRTLALSLCAALALAPAAQAETRWYRVEVLAFTQPARSSELALRPVPPIPADARALDGDAPVPATLGQLELFMPAAAVRDATEAGAGDGLARWVDDLDDATYQAGIDGRLAELVEWQPAPRRPPAPAPGIDPAIAAEVAEAERLEREKKLKAQQARAFQMPAAWAYRALPRQGLTLDAAATRLRQKPGYGVLLHRGWLQPVRTGGSGEPVLLTVPNGGALARLRPAADQLLLSLAVWQPAAPASPPGPAPTAGSASAPPAAPGTAAPGAASPGAAAHAPATLDTLVATALLRASVRPVSGKTYYVDGAGVGALIRVDFVNRDVAASLDGL